MVVIVLGLPDLGKSYFTERFARKLGSEYMNGDRLQKEMSHVRNNFLRKDYAWDSLGIVTATYIHAIYSCCLNHNRSIA